MTSKIVKTEVFKSSLDLGEQSVEEFSADLHSALRAEFPGFEWLWVNQLHGNRAIVYMENDSQAGSFEVAFVRTSDGFTFGEPIEVTAMTIYVRV